MKISQYLICSIFFLTAATVNADTESVSQKDLELMKMDLQALMDLDILSVSKRKEAINDVAAAITVITQEDIRRSGATSIVELMRLVPGYIVARIDSNKWSASSSEDSNRLADDMTVMIDNRPLYSSFFGGVFWEHVDLVFEDIQRIEVIRGPAGKIWGANTGRGLVNIVTKSSKDTQGALVSLAGGTEERGQVAIRYGGKIGDAITYRFSAKGTERDASHTKDAADDWRNGLLSFRADWQATEHDDVDINVGYYRAKTGQRISMPSLTDINETETQVEDANYASYYSSTDWRHRISDTAGFDANFFYDHIRRDDLSVFNVRDRFSFSVSNHFDLPWDQHFLWGLYYLNEQDQSRAGRIIAMRPANIDMETYAGYLQDEIGFFDNRLRMSVGASVMKHSFVSDPQFQPSFRMAWSFTENQTFWLAVTRTSQIPNRLEKNGIHWLQPDQDNEFEAGKSWIALRGNPKQFAEENTGYQVGYRGKFSAVSFDLSGFVVHERDAPFQTVTENDTTFRYLNGDKENIYGVQLALDWQPLPWWRLKSMGSYMFIEHVGEEDTSQAGEEERPEFLENAGWPAYQYSLRSLMDLSEHWEFDTTLRYVDKLQETAINGYYNLDARLGWKPNKHWELSLVGQNLLQDHHQETFATFFPTQSAKIERGIYARVVWKF